MNFRRGDIVLADLPYSDRTGSKKRPALVVQWDHNNRRLDDVILAMITTVTERAASEPTQRLIEIKTPEGQQSGLLHDSSVNREHLIILHRHFLGRVIGHLSPTVMAGIDRCLKESLGLMGPAVAFSFSHKSASQANCRARYLLMKDKDNERLLASEPD
jgi:mRNA interferase MazF